MMNLPAGSNMPWIIEFLKWSFFPIETLDNRLKKYGDNFRVGTGNPPLVYFSSPDALRTIFSLDSEILRADVGPQLIPLLGENSLIVAQGDYHHNQRKILQKPLNPNQLYLLGNSICKISKECFIECSVSGKVIVRKIFQNITLKVIFTLIFGDSEENDNNDLYEHIFELLDLVGSTYGLFILFFPFLQLNLGSNSSWGKFQEKSKIINSYIENKIQERRTHNTNNNEDILSILIISKDDAGEPLSNDVIRDEIITILFAGFESTASSLAWATYLIYENSKVREKLINELAEFDIESNISLVQSLPYLNAICLETLRIYPVVINASPRIANTSVNILEYTLPTGTRIIPSIYIAHHRESVYPQPFLFKPERFLNRKFDQYEYLPFGGGNRKCLGSHLAMYEMKLILSILFQNFDICMEHGNVVKPVRRGITLAPPNTLQISLRSKI